MKNSPWWVWSAALIAGLMVLLGVGNLIDDDGGPLFGQIILLAVMAGAATLVAVGIRRRISDAKLGNRLIGLGVIPGVMGLALFWFPPAVAVGVLSIVTSVAAFRDAKGMTAAARATASGAVLLVLTLTVFSVGAS
ncbi:MAG: hypothetical protein HKN91_06785 [Acidimicrobiia bacterium]|nr:hypothetical protein [Acidimicrobiia bacterium]